MQNVTDHLVLRGFRKKINHSQVRLDLRKQIGDNETKIKTIMERALHLETVTAIEEEEETPKFKAIRHDDRKDLVEVVNKLLNQWSVDAKKRENLRNQSRGRSGLRGRWGVNRRDTGQQHNRGLSDRRRLDPATETDPLEEMNRLGTTTGRVSSAEPVNKKDTFLGIVEFFCMLKFPTLEKKVPFQKENHREP